MSTCSGCNAITDCPEDQDTVFPYSLTPGSPFPYVINCPEGVNCSEALSITMQCCGSPVTATIPAGASADERAAIVQQLVAQCAFLESGCANPPTSPPPGTPNPPSIPTGSNIYYSHAFTSSATCSNGGVYRARVEAGRFAGRTQLEADSLARAFIRAFVAANKFCLNIPSLENCKDDDAEFRIPTVRGTGPFAASITSGTLPTGLTLSVSGGVIVISGTPTVAGDAAITLRVNDGLGGYLTQDLTIEIEDCSSPGMYYALGETTGGIAVDSFGVNNTDANQGARTLVSGPIVAAWLFDSVVPPVGLEFPSSTLSDKTEIPSKSITIRFWVQCLDPVTIFEAFENFVLATRYFRIGIKDGALDGAYNKSPDSGTGFGFICFANGDSVDDGNWHRIIFVYNATTGEARFQVDNNTPTLETVNQSLIVEGGPITPTEPEDTVAFQICPYVHLLGGYPTPYEDPGYYSGVNLAEIFIGPDIIWDNADCTYDWNGGAGRTYPDLP